MLSDFKFGKRRVKYKTLFSDSIFLSRIDMSGSLSPSWAVCPHSYSGYTWYVNSQGQKCWKSWPTGKPCQHELQFSLVEPEIGVSGESKNESPGPELKYSQRQLQEFLGAKI